MGFESKMIIFMYVLTLGMTIFVDSILSSRIVAWFSFPPYLSRGENDFELLIKRKNPTIPWTCMLSSFDRQLNFSLLLYVRPSQQQR